jgi:3-oxoadipate enol-lactonase
MSFARRDGCLLHYEVHPGTPGTRPIVFANSLGTDVRIWDATRAALDPAIPTLALDKRGHGLSGTGETTLAGLAADTAALMEAHGLSGALVCGVSVGGLVAQQLAADRPDLCAGLVLCNTGLTIQTPQTWDDRIALVERGGIEALADGAMERWFSPAWRAGHPDELEGWRTLLVRTPVEGYLAVCRVLRDADMTKVAPSLSLPVVCVAGSEDGATPPDLLEALAAAIPGAEFRLFEGVGHQPEIEAPEDLARLLAEFHARLG